MPSLSRCFASLALVLGSAGGIRKKYGVTIGATPEKGSRSTTKTIAGVPVLNYQAAYGGKANLEQLDRLETVEEQDWVVVVNSGTSDAQIQSMCSASKNGCNFNGNATGGFGFVSLRGTESDLEAVLKNASGVAKFAEPDLEVKMIPLLKPKNVLAATWGLTRIGADQRGTTGAGATIFVLDTGVRVSHQEFEGRAFPAMDVSSGSPIVCYDGTLNCATDNQGHGTHCAGTAAGQAYGVAPGAALGAIKVLNDQGSGSWSWSYSALDWLALHPTRPAVASMSLGGAGALQAMKEAVDGAVDAGVTVVVAAGNEDSDSCGYSPAFIPSAITVGSTTSGDERSYFSNYGACTKIWAPGSDVLSAGISSDSSTAVLSGTSMACPHVSGAAALVLSADPSKRSPEVLSDLLANAITNGLTGLMPGDTNALLYVGASGPPPTPEPVPTPVPVECPANSNGPDTDGDCMCMVGLYCWNNGVRGDCPFSYGYTSDQWFLPSCSGCECLSYDGSAPAICNPAFSSGPDSDGDCRCYSGLVCYLHGVRGACPFSYGYTSTTWFLPSCTDCICINAAPAVGLNLLFIIGLLAFTMGM